MAEITSANIVGYADRALNSQAGKKNFICGQFKNVNKDGKDMTVGDLTPNALFQFDNDMLQIFDSDGNIQYGLYYCSAADLVAYEIIDEFPEAVPGWYTVSQVDDDWDFSTNMNDIPLPMGCMVLVTTDNEGAGIISSGEVLGEDLPLDLNTAAGKKNFIGNCSPVDLTLGEIKANDIFQFDNDMLQIFDSDGNIQYGLYYCSAADLVAYEIIDEFPEAVPGWYTVSQVDDDWDFSTNMNDLPCNAGDTFLVTSDNPGAQIIIPAAY